jgi:hypothetical protein
MRPSRPWGIAVAAPPLGAMKEKGEEGNDLGLRGADAVLQF